MHGYMLETWYPEINTDVYDKHRSSHTLCIFKIVLLYGHKKRAVKL